MKFINQRDYPHWLYVTRTDMEGEDKERGKTTTVFTSGCGLAAAVMAADRLLPNCDFDLKQALDISYETKANFKIGTQYRRFAPVFAERLGLRWESSKNVEDVIRCLTTGGTVVTAVYGDRDGKPGVFAHSGHFINVIGVEPDGRLAIMDPYLYDGKYEEEGRKGIVEMVHGVIILSPPEVLAKETEGKTSPFYLFWRK